MTETILYKVIPKENVFEYADYIQGIKEEIEEKYIILLDLKITPDLDGEGIKKLTDELKKRDYDIRLKYGFEFCYGMPYEEKHRAMAEELERNKKEPSEWLKKTMLKAFLGGKE